LLVLSRKRHEAITIGDGILISLQKSSYDCARIGIIAPRDLQIHRITAEQALHRQLQMMQRAGIVDSHFDATALSAVAKSDEPEALPAPRGFAWTESFHVAVAAARQGGAS